MWVTPGQRELEYFETRAPRSSFLYLGEITYDAPFSRAAVLVRRGRGAGQPEEKWLLLERQGDHWVIIGERAP